MSVAEILNSRQQRANASVAGQVITHVPEGELRMIVGGLDALVVSSSDATGSGRTSTCDGTCFSCC